MIAVALIDYFKYYKIPEWGVDALLLIAGVWMLTLGMEHGYYKKRKEILKRYI